MTCRLQHCILKPVFRRHIFIFLWKNCFFFLSFSRPALNVPTVSNKTLTADKIPPVFVSALEDSYLYTPTTVWPNFQIAFYNKTHNILPRYQFRLSPPHFLSAFSHSCKVFIVVPLSLTQKGTHTHTHAGDIEVTKAVTASKPQPPNRSQKGPTVCPRSVLVSVESWFSPPPPPIPHPSISPS